MGRWVALLQEACEMPIGEIAEDFVVVLEVPHPVLVHPNVGGTVVLRVIGKMIKWSPFGIMGELVGEWNGAFVLL